MTTELVTVESLRNQLYDWKSIVPKAHAFLENKIKEAANEGECCIEHVPTDCLLLIFEFLSKKYLVAILPYISRQWRGMVRHPMFWNVFNIQQLLLTSELPLGRRYRPDPLFSPSRYDKEQFWFRRLINGGFNAKYFELQASTIHRRDITGVLRAVKNVEGFDFSHCTNVYDEMLRDMKDTLICEMPIAEPSTVFGSCKKTEIIGENSGSIPLSLPVSHSFRTLKLNFCDEFSEASFLDLIAAVPSIEHLEVSGCEQISSQGFRTIFASLPELTHLKCRTARLSQASFLDLETVAPLRLQILNMANCASADDALLQKLAKFTPDLRELVASSCQFITDGGINAVKSATAELVLLVLDNCPQVGEASLYGLTKALCHLKYLSVEKTKLSGPALESLLTYPLGLEMLSAAGCLQAARDVARSSSLQNLLQSRSSLLTAPTRQFFSFSRKTR